MLKELMYTKEFVEIVTSPMFIIVEVGLFVLIIIGLILIFRDSLRRKCKNDKNIITIDISKRHSETFSQEDLSITDILQYFKETYDFDIGNDSIKIIDKANEYLNRVKSTYNEAKIMLYSVEFGVCDRGNLTRSLNEFGGLMIMTSNELDIMFRLFAHLVKTDPTYEDEFFEINKIKTEYEQVEKKLINVCLTLISEYPCKA